MENTQRIWILCLIVSSLSCLMAVEVQGMVQEEVELEKKRIARKPMCLA